MQSKLRGQQQPPRIFARPKVEKKLDTENKAVLEQMEKGGLRMRLREHVDIIYPPGNYFDEAEIELLQLYKSFFPEEIRDKYEEALRMCVAEVIQNFKQHGGTGLELFKEKDGVIIFRLEPYLAQGETGQTIVDRINARIQKIKTINNKASQDAMIIVQDFQERTQASIRAKLKKADALGLRLTERQRETIETGAAASSGRGSSTLIDKMADFGYKVSYKADPQSAKHFLIKIQEIKTKTGKN